MPKKLIEVSLPLEAINVASAREKSIRHGHPSTLHLWWARRPLAACRAVLFSSLVDDPSEYMPDEASAHAERERLFDIIKDLVVWENSNNEEVLDKAKLEIARSVARNLGVNVPVGKAAVREFLATKAPPVLDPFAGGGSIPLEAQRLGLRAYASDLNPVAVLINKALIEIPPKFADLPPVHPPEEEQGHKKKGKKGEGTIPLFAREWKGAQGLAEDLRYYGKWMRDEAIKHIGHLYPPVIITKEILDARPDLKEQGFKEGSQLTVIAWLWARTVKCPNPACGVQMPLARSFDLSVRKGKATWVEPVVKGNKIDYVVKTGVGKSQEGTVNRNGAHCVGCNTPVPFDYVREEARAGRMHAQMMAIATEGNRQRAYFSPTQNQIDIALNITPTWEPETDLPEKALGFRIQLYGMKKHSDLFTSRQLMSLTTFSDLVDKGRALAFEEAKKLQDRDPVTYSNAIAVYLAFAVSKTVNRSNTICTWKLSVECPGDMFTKQSVQMTWDYAESNVVNGPSGSFESMLSNTIAGLLSNQFEVIAGGTVSQQDATTLQVPQHMIISTDPPYYDNIGYADLSDIFYVWLRRALGNNKSDLFRTLLVPKSEELIAAPFRFGGDKEKAESFFEQGLSKTFIQLKEAQHGDYPLTVFYAFKQSESEADDNHEMNVASTGWETMLEGLMKSGYTIVGTLPMRTERANRTVAMDANALASSIVLVCRLKSSDAVSASRREFLSALKKELALALRELQQGSIAPVDLAQASIGPGMAVFSRYSAVLEADGTPMSVRTALGLINQALDEFLTEQEGEYDSDTRWALAWYEQFGHNEAPFGVAETLSKAKNTSVNGLVEAGILEARAGKVRLLKRDEVDTDWDPTQDKRLTAWEACQHLIYALENSGEEAAASLLAKLGSTSEPARDLSYRLYTVCERKGWAQDALGYNMLVVAWPRLKELAARKVEPGQGKLM